MSLHKKAVSKRVDWVSNEQLFNTYIHRKNVIVYRASRAAGVRKTFNVSHSHTVFFFFSLSFHPYHHQHNLSPHHHSPRSFLCNNSVIIQLIFFSSLFVSKYRNVKMKDVCMYYSGRWTGWNMSNDASVGSQRAQSGQASKGEHQFFSKMIWMEEARVEGPIIIILLLPSSLTQFIEISQPASDYFYFY